MAQNCIDQETIYSLYVEENHLLGTVYIKYMDLGNGQKDTKVSFCLNLKTNMGKQLPIRWHTLAFRYV